MGKMEIDYSKNILFNPKHLIIKIIHVNYLLETSAGLYYIC